MEQARRLRRDRRAGSTRRCSWRLRLPSWRPSTALLRQPFIYSVPGKLLYGLAAVLWLAIVPAWLLLPLAGARPPAAGVTGVLVLLPFWQRSAGCSSRPSRLLAAMGVVWIADIAAYFAGRRFGRHKLAPQISPGKTWEGVAGRSSQSFCTGAQSPGCCPSISGQFCAGLVLVVMLTAVGILGDLFESWMKRVAGLKDSGTLLPGHGGVLDRVDALTSTLPLAALYFAYPLLVLTSLGMSRFDSPATPARHAASAHHPRGDRLHRRQHAGRGGASSGSLPGDRRLPPIARSSGCSSSACVSLRAMP